LVIRDGNGDIGVRDSYASRAFYVGTSAGVNKKLSDTAVTATGGSINIYGFNGVLGVSIGDGSVISDRVSTYRNNSHRFRLNDDSAFAPIQVSSIITPDVTTGGASTVGTLTGNWSMATTSNLTLGTGTINARGIVGGIGGINEKIESAKKVGATLFFAPVSNAAEIANVPAGIKVVTVATLAQAISYLENN
jgi:hypothetical protein